MKLGAFYLLDNWLDGERERERDRQRGRRRERERERTHKDKADIMVYRTAKSIDPTVAFIGHQKTRPPSTSCNPQMLDS